MPLYRVREDPREVRIEGTFSGQSYIRYQRFDLTPPYESWFNSYEAEGFLGKIGSYDESYYTGLGVHPSGRRWLTILDPWGALEESSTTVPSSEWNSNPGAPPPNSNWTKADGGSFYFECTVDLYLFTYTPDGAQEIDGVEFPGIPLVDEDGFLIGHGSAQPDGMPASGDRYLWIMRPGTKWRASVSTYPGSGAALTLTVERDVTEANAMAVDLVGLVKVMPSGGDGQPAAVATIEADGLTFGESASGSDALGSYSFGPGTVSMAGQQAYSAGGQFASNRSFALLRGEPDMDYALDLQIRTPEGAHPGSFDVWVADKRRLNPDTGSYEPSAQKLTATGSLALAIKQRYWVHLCRAANPGGPGAGSTLLRSAVKEERQPVRAWLDEAALAAAGEDSRDWALPFQSWPWAALLVERADSVELVPDGEWNAGAPTRATAFSKCHGYRYAYISRSGIGGTTGGTGTGVLNLVAGAKQYPFDALAFYDLGPGAVWHEFDLCLGCGNVPSEVTADERDSIFPVVEGYSPTAGKPQWDEEDEQDETLPEERRGWINFGILQRITSVGMTGLATGGVIDNIDGRIILSGRRDTNLSIAATTPARAGVLQSFLPRLQGHASPTDRTFYDPLLWCYSDDLLVGPWPYRAKVEPISGSGNYFVYWDLDTLASFATDPEGWGTTVQVAQDWPALASNTATKLRNGTIQSANLVDYLWNGSAWSQQIDRPLPYTFWACLLADEVSAYPGCGEPDAGTYDAPYELRCSKVVGAQAEVLVRNSDGPVNGATARLIRQTDGSNRGQDTTGTNGAYRTGSPFGIGNAQHRTQLIGGTQPFEGPFSACNRYRHRTGFLFQRTGIGPRSYDVFYGAHAETGSLRHYWATTKDGKAHLFSDDNALAKPWVWVDTTFPAQSVHLKVDRRERHGRLHLTVEDGGSIKRRLSENDGATWTMATTIGSGKKPFGFIGQDGLERIYWLTPSGTPDEYNVIGKVLDRSATVVQDLTGSPLLTGVKDVTNCSDESPIDGGKHRIVLTYEDTGGNIVRVTSIDGGQTFT